MKEMMDKSMTKQEYELKRAEEDMMVENAEVYVYLMLIQKCQIAVGTYLNAITPLSKNMQDEQEQADWLKTHSPGMLTQLWPKYNLQLLLILLLSHYNKKIGGKHQK